METADVIIIGAGFAGLAAAEKLQDSNKKVIVLEARDRVGGRAFTLHENDVTIDLGAQWVGLKHKRMDNLIRRFGLTLIPTYNDGKTLYYLNGKKKGSNRKIPPLSPLAKLDLFRIQTTFNKLLKVVPAEKPWDSPIAKELDGITVETWLKRNVLTKEGRAFYNAFAGDILCTTFNELSIFEVIWLFSTYGSFEALQEMEEYWVAEGMQVLAEKYAASFHGSIHLNKRVTGIKWGFENKVIVSSACEQWRAKRVIITIPPALAGRMEYDPPLPALRDQLTQRVAQSSIIKAIVVYNKPFWREKNWNGMIVSDKGPFRVTLDSSPKDKPYGVLTILISGDQARIYGAIDQEKRKSAVIHSIANLFGQQAMEPIGYYEKNWNEDPFTRGGYAGHLLPGVITQFGPFLWEPIGPIHWAGTETSTEHRLYMEGALQSGERVALEVIKSLE